MEIYRRCYSVEEWKDVPELLNDFISIPLDVEDLLAIRSGQRGTKSEELLAKSLPWKKFFIRTSMFSPKDSGVDHNRGIQARCFTTAYDALYAIGCSSRCMSKIGSRLWVAEWKDLSDYTHYRVFIRDSQIRAISQYDNSEPPTHPEEVAKDIQALWERVEESVWYTDCVMDVVHRSKSVDLPTGDVRIVEFNEYGASSRAGSALFNWIQDFHELYYGSGVIRVNAF